MNFWTNGDDEISSTVLPILLVGLITASIVWFNLAVQFENLHNDDAHYLAQLARNIARGKGFVTNCITPLRWSFVPTTQNHPEFGFAPLYPHLVASGFVLFGVEAFVPALVSGLALIGISIFTFLIGRRLFNPWSGLVAAVLLVTHSSIGYYGMIGKTETLHLLLILASVLIVLRDDDHPILLGITSALAYLTRFNHWFWMIGILWFALSKTDDRKTRYLVPFFTSFFVVLLPFMVRNLRVIGVPFFQRQYYELLRHTESYPGYEIFRTFNPPNPWLFALNNPLALVRKWFQNIFSVYQVIPDLFETSWIVALVGIGEISLLQNEKWNFRTRGVFYSFSIGFLLQAALLPFVRVLSRYFLPIVPALFIFAGKGFHRLMKNRGKTITYSIIFILLGTNIYFLTTLETNNNIETESLTSVRRFVPKNEPILTNIPINSSWYTDRHTLALTGYETALSHYGQFNYVLISSTPEAIMSRSQSRRFIGNRRFQREFRLIEKFPDARFRLFARVTSNN